MVDFGKQMDMGFPFYLILKTMSFPRPSKPGILDWLESFEREGGRVCSQTSVIDGLYLSSSRKPYIILPSVLCSVPTMHTQECATLGHEFGPNGSPS